MKTITILIAGLLLFIHGSLNSQIPIQTIRGTVVDITTKTPVPGATVSVINSVPARGAITDKTGKFRIKDVPVGRCELRITCIGYKENMISALQVNSGKEVVLEVSLEESVVQSKEVIVQADKDLFNPNNDLIVTSVTILRPETINRFAGSRQDPSRIAASCAGVSGGDDNRNDIIVRGNSPMGVLWRLEGVDIPNPNHFAIAGNTGGPFAILNNNLLSNTDFLTGAFPSEYGNKTAAVFDVKLRNGNNEKREYTFQLGLSGVEAGAEGPFSQSYSGSYLASFRYFTLSPLKSLGMDFGENMDPTFLDGTVKINLPTKSYGIFNLWGIGGKSRASIMRSTDSKIDWTKTTRVTDENIDEYMFAAGLNNTHFFSDNLFGVLNLSNSELRINTHNDMYYRDKTMKPDEYFLSKEGQYLAGYNLNYKVNANHFIKAGISYREMYYRIYYWDWDDWQEQYFTRVDSKNNSGLVEGYIHWRNKITDLLETDAGIYSQLFTLNNSKALEPRAAIKYQFTDNQNIGFAYGMHSQTHPLLYYFYSYSVGKDNKGNDIMVQPNKNLDFQRAHHFVLSYNNRIFSDFNIKAELYYQYLYDVPVSLVYYDSTYSFINVGADFSFQARDSTVNKGTGKNYGIELTLEKYFKNGYYFLITTSLFKSRYTGNDGVERPTAFDIGHVINMLGGKEFPLDASNQYVLSVDMKLNHSGGRRITPIIIDESIKQGYEVLDRTNAYGQQLQDYFRIDLKISLNINLSGTTHNIFLAADNLTNNKNLYKQEWNQYSGGLKNSYQMGMFPYIGYRVNF